MPVSTAPAPGGHTAAQHVDPRLVVGAVVHTKTLNVSNFMEVSRFRGSLAKEAFVDGKVLEVILGKDKGGRNKTDQRVAW